MSTGELRSVDSLRSVGSTGTTLGASTVDPIVDSTGEFRASAVDSRAPGALDSTGTGVDFIRL